MSNYYFKYRIDSTRSSVVLIDVKSQNKELKDTTVLIHTLVVLARKVFCVVGDSISKHGAVAE